MFAFLAVLYVLICMFLILVVLLQSGKGGGMGALGGGAAGSQTVFGGAGAGNFLTRLTSICAALFMILSASLSYLSSRGEASLDRAAEQEENRNAQVEGEGDEGEGDEGEGDEGEGGAGAAGEEGGESGEGASSEGIAAAFRYAVEQGADVITNSWGRDEHARLAEDPEVRAAIELAARSGRDGRGSSRAW